MTPCSAPRTESSCASTVRASPSGSRRSGQPLLPQRPQARDEGSGDQQHQRLERGSVSESAVEDKAVHDESDGEVGECAAQERPSAPQRLAEHHQRGQEGREERVAPDVGEDAEPVLSRSGQHGMLGAGLGVDPEWDRLTVVVVQGDQLERDQPQLVEWVRDHPRQRLLAQETLRLKLTLGTRDRRRDLGEQRLGGEVGPTVCIRVMSRPERGGEIGAERDERVALATVAGVEGWLSDDQAQRLWERARELEPGASMVEIGSFRGRSAIVLALAAPASSVLHAIDPHAGGDRGPREIADDPVAGASDIAAFRANLESAGVSGRVRHVRLPSTQALAVVTDPIDLLYIDGAHRYAPAREDIKRWGARVKPGGVMLIHDGFSSVGVTVAVVRLLALGRSVRLRGSLAIAAPVSAFGAFRPAACDKRGSTTRGARLVCPQRDHQARDRHAGALAAALDWATLRKSGLIRRTAPAELLVCFRRNRRNCAYRCSRATGAA